MSTVRDRIDSYSLALDASIFTGENFGWNGIKGKAEQILYGTEDRSRLAHGVADIASRHTPSGEQPDGESVVVSEVGQRQLRQTRREALAEGKKEGFDNAKSQMLQSLDELLAVQPKKRADSGFTLGALDTKTLNKVREFVASFHAPTEPR